MKVLLVGIDKNTTMLLEQSSCLVEIAEVYEVEDIAEYLTVSNYDACVINLDEKGWGAFVCRVIRTKNIKTPIVGLSSGGVSAWAEYRALFLENGGDDLLKSPVNPRELSATLSAISRRYSSLSSDIVSFDYDGKTMKINMPACSVTVGGNHLHLTVQEYRMLIILVRATDRVISKEKLLESMYVDGVNDYPEVKVIDVFVCKLRKKLNTAHNGLGSVIETVWGRGYKFTTSTANISQQMLA
jgi:two-component system, cell cycle response regulator CtrA